jgi:hypothetical protein
LGAATNRTRAGRWATIVIGDENQAITFDVRALLA